MIAFERYALGAQAVDHQLSVQQALVHKEVVVEIACTAKSAGRSELLGVLYDELARCVLGVVRIVVCEFRALLYQEEVGRLVRQVGQQLQPC